MSKSRSTPKPHGPKTKTLPEGQQDYFFAGPDPVTWIHIAGTVHQFELPKDARQIKVGSAPDCDIVVPSRYISKHHCTLERLYDGLRVHDHSKNGTSVDAHRVSDTADLRAGKTFAAGGGITFLALNDAMRRAYPLLSDLLGWETETSLVPPTPREATPGHVIQLAAGVDHLLINGDRGCGQDKLARAIHLVSPLRKQQLVWVDAIPTDRTTQKDLLVRATRTTMVLNVGDDMPVMDEAFRSALFSASYRIRVIAIASPRRASAVLGEHHALRQTIELRPLAYRAEQIAWLLDRQLEERRSSLRFASLREKNRKALLRYEWPENFDELCRAADRIVAVERTKSLRAAAELIDEARWTFQYWWSSKVGLDKELT